MKKSIKQIVKERLHRRSVVSARDYDELKAERDRLQERCEKLTNLLAERGIEW